MQTVDPRAVGLDAARLARIETHFRAYVNDGRLPGFDVVVMRGESVAWRARHGWAQVERREPLREDAIYRIYSMTKPIASVALMMLVEEGRVRLTEPVGTYLPSFAAPRVYADGGVLVPRTVEAREPMHIWHLLTHTAGLTYGFHYATPVDEIYRRAGFDFGSRITDDLATLCDRYATLPLLHEPGASWNYSVATDVVGRIVEVASGRSLDEFLRERIFDPLGMRDTAFWVDEARHERLAGLYTGYLRTPATFDERLDRAGRRRPAYWSGGGGLTSTVADYVAFMRMLVRRGAAGPQGGRLLSRPTVDLMTTNHLPGGVDIGSWGYTYGWPEYAGMGFGLGFSVQTGYGAGHTYTPAGMYGWGGMASTAFWIDPVHDLAAAFFTQLIPSTTWPIRDELRALVYGALLD
jgi:CubicO group peptidase (beta-lactamase class C family)